MSPCASSSCHLAYTISGIPTPTKQDKFHTVSCKFSELITRMFSLSHEKKKETPARLDKSVQAFQLFFVQKIEAFVQKPKTFVQTSTTYHGNIRNIPPSVASINTFCRGNPRNGNFCISPVRRRNGARRWKDDEYR